MRPPQQLMFHLICLLLPLLLFGQAHRAYRPIGGTIMGTVFGPDSLPVTDAHVLIKKGLPADVSDNLGHFQLSPLPAGVYSLEITHVSYQKKTVKNIRLRADAITQLDTIYLQAHIYPQAEVMVTASRHEQPAHLIAQTVNLVDPLEIFTRNSATTAEALREEKGVFIQKTNHGGGSAIIRGLSSNHILILVDGIRLNNATYRLGNHQYLTTVDANALKAIEIIHGPGSMLYGSDALGGVINLIGRRAVFTKNGKRVRYRSFGRFSAADQSLTTHADWQISNSSLAWNGGASYHRFGDLRNGASLANLLLSRPDGNTRQSPSAYRGYDFNNVFSFKLNPGQKFKLLWQRSRQFDVPRYDKYLYNDYHTWLYEPQLRDLFYIRSQTDFNGSPFQSLQITLSLNRQQEGRIKQRKLSDPKTSENDDIRTLGLQAHTIARIRSHIFTAGFEVYHDDVHSTARRFDGLETLQLPRGRFPDKSTYLSSGVFIQDEFPLNTRTFLTSGLRYAWFQTRFTDPTPQIGQVSENFAALTASVALLYEAQPGLQLSMVLANGFRAPNLSDLAKLGESKGNTYEVPSPNLHPERINSFELGAHWKKNQIEIRGAAYFSLLDNLLTRENVLYQGQSTIIIDGQIYKIKSRSNGGAGFITGSEAGFRYSFSRDLFLDGNLAYTYGQNKSRNEPFDGIPPFFGKLELGWQRSNSELQFYSRFASLQPRLSTDAMDDPRIPVGGTPGWFTLNIRGRYIFSENIQINMAIENLLDRLYREHGSGINAPGRNFILGLQISG